MAGFDETPPPTWQEIAEALSVKCDLLRLNLEEANALLADVDSDPTPLAKLCGRLRVERDEALAAMEGAIEERDRMQRVAAEKTAAELERNRLRDELTEADRTIVKLRHRVRALEAERDDQQPQHVHHYNGAGRCRCETAPAGSAHGARDARADDWHDD